MKWACFGCLAVSSRILTILEDEMVSVFFLIEANQIQGFHQSAFKFKVSSFSYQWALVPSFDAFNRYLTQLRFQTLSSSQSSSIFQASYSSRTEKLVQSFVQLQSFQTSIDSHLHPQQTLTLSPILPCPFLETPKDLLLIWVSVSVVLSLTRRECKHTVSPRFSFAPPSRWCCGASSGCKLIYILFLLMLRSDLFMTEKHSPNSASEDGKWDCS